MDYALKRELEEIYRADKKRLSQKLQAMSAGLVGVGVIVIVEMVGVAQLDRALTVCLYSFLISIPSLTTVFLTSFEDSKHHHAAKVVWPVDILWAIGAISSLVGLGALLGHFSIRASILFALLTVICLTVWAHHSYQLSQANP